jgi:hypothetical protein
VLPVFGTRRLIDRQIVQRRNDLVKRESHFLRYANKSKTTQDVTMELTLITQSALSVKEASSLVISHGRWREAAALRNFTNGKEVVIHLTFTFLKSRLT